MRQLVMSVLAGAAVFAAPAGTSVPDDPAPTVSETASALDTTVNGLAVATDVSPLDTLLVGSDWSPWPGIFLNTKPFRGFFIVIR